MTSPDNLDHSKLFLDFDYAEMERKIAAMLLTPEGREQLAFTMIYGPDGAPIGTSVGPRYGGIDGSTSPTGRRDHGVP